MWWGPDWDRGLPEMWMEIEEQEIVFSSLTIRDDLTYRFPKILVSKIICTDISR